MNSSDPHHARFGEDIPTASPLLGHSAEACFFDDERSDIEDEREVKAEHPSLVSTTSYLSSVAEFPTVSPHFPEHLSDALDDSPWTTSTAANGHPNDSHGMSIAMPSLSRHEGAPKRYATPVAQRTPGPRQHCSEDATTSRRTKRRIPPKEKKRDGWATGQAGDGFTFSTFSSPSALGCKEALLVPSDPYLDDHRGAAGMHDRAKERTQEGVKERGEAHAPSRDGRKLPAMYRRWDDDMGTRGASEWEGSALQRTRRRRGREASVESDRWGRGREKSASIEEEPVGDTLLSLPSSTSRTWCSMTPLWMRCDGEPEEAQETNPRHRWTALLEDEEEMEERVESSDGFFHPFSSPPRAVPKKVPPSVCSPTPPPPRFHARSLLFQEDVLRYLPHLLLPLSVSTSLGRERVLDSICPLAPSTCDGHSSDREVIHSPRPEPPPHSSCCVSSPSIPLPDGHLSPSSDSGALPSASLPLDSGYSALQDPSCGSVGEEGDPDTPHSCHVSFPPLPSRRSHPTFHVQPNSPANEMPTVWKASEPHAVGALRKGPSVSLPSAASPVNPFVPHVQFRVVYGRIGIERPSSSTTPPYHHGRLEAIPSSSFSASFSPVSEEAMSSIPSASGEEVEVLDLPFLSCVFRHADYHSPSSSASLSSSLTVYLAPGVRSLPSPIFRLQASGKFSLFGVRTEEEAKAATDHFLRLLHLSPSPPTCVVGVTPPTGGTPGCAATPTAPLDRTKCRYYLSYMRTATVTAVFDVHRPIRLYTLVSAFQAGKPFPLPEAPKVCQKEVRETCEGNGILSSASSSASSTGGLRRRASSEGSVIHYDGWADCDPSGLCGRIDFRFAPDDAQGKQSLNDGSPSLETVFPTLNEIVRCTIHVSGRLRFTARNEALIRKAFDCLLPWVSPCLVH